MARTPPLSDLASDTLPLRVTQWDAEGFDFHERGARWWVSGWRRAALRYGRSPPSSSAPPGSRHEHGGALVRRQICRFLRNLSMGVADLLGEWVDTT
jgi:hypothetical protein